MKEIGGYLEFELKFKGKEYHDNAIRLNLARNALLYLKETEGYKKIYIPYFLCDCISNLMKKYSIDISYYHVNENGRPIFDKILKKQEAIWIVNYYGQLTKEEIFKYKEKWEHIILDNTHDFFSKVIDGIDTIYSARKYFGIPDGGYLYTNKHLDKELEQGYSFDRVRHLVGSFEKTRSEFYTDFLLSENTLNEEGLKSMSLFSKNILSGIDYENIFKIRTKNFLFLNHIFFGINKWKLSELPGTYMYPLWCEQGAQIRKKLIEKKIYIPVLWPNVLKILPSNTIEYQMVTNILPIPIDQRYSEIDMEYVANAILEIIKK